MKLNDWLNLPNSDGSPKRRDAFARDIGVTPQMISAYCSGRIWPSKETMQAIVKYTDGDVSANDFIDMKQSVA